MQASTPSILPPSAILLGDLAASPSEVAAAFPQNEPIIALIGGGAEATWSRWSIVAPAGPKRLTLRTGDSLDAFASAMHTPGPPTLLPGWIGFLSYDLGRVIEPAVGDGGGCDSWPLADLWWCDRALIHDAVWNQWWSVGGLRPPPLPAGPPGSLRCGPLVDPIGADAFTEAVSQTIGFIEAGDIFQANITRRFRAEIDGDVRGAAIAALENNGGWFGAYIEFPGAPDRSLFSLSPELFLRYDATSRRVVTRPMKGTRPSDADPSALLSSPKDAAELHMIVDLMRNDLGRVCEFGSIGVPSGRALEEHPTVLQCVGQVEGTLRQDRNVVDLLNATFPPGSVTGAPKIRAMQVIDELEVSPRGPYCGAIGVMGRSAELSVAIRTAAIMGERSASGRFRGTLTYGAGCGIVADSRPVEELAESEVKVRSMRRAIMRRGAAPVAESQPLA